MIFGNVYFIHLTVLDLYQDYIHKVPVILHDDRQRESHKPYGPPTSVTWLELQRMKKSTGIFVAMTRNTDLCAHDIVHSHDLWNYLRLNGGFVELTLLFLPLFFAMTAITDLVVWDLRLSGRPVFYPEYADSRFLQDITTYLTDYVTSRTRRKYCVSTTQIQINYQESTVFFDRQRARYLYKNGLNS